jgi:large subunit ribosomal protein L15
MQASNLQASGEDVVLTGALYAIIGALALERGGGVANRVVKEKILTPLGLS